MSNITKNYKVGLFAMFIAAALIGSVVAFGDNMAYAGGKHKKSNDAEQAIEQDQENEQNAQCVSGDIYNSWMQQLRLHVPKQRR